MQTPRDSLVDWFKVVLAFCCLSQGVLGGLRRVLLVKCLVERMSNSRGPVMFAAVSWCAYLLASSCFPTTLLILPWLPSVVRLCLHWLMRVERSLSLGAAGTHLTHSICFRITVKMICQSQVGWEFAPYGWHQSILHLLHYRVSLQA